MINNWFRVVWQRRRRFVGLVGVLLASGCASESTGANLGTPSHPISAGPNDDQRPQIILRFKDSFPALTKPDCVTAYLAIAGVQKGFSMTVVRSLFSGAHVVSLRATQSTSEPLAFIQYLSHQSAVDYAELDTALQTKPSASSPQGARPVVAPKVTAPLDAIHVKTRAQLVFRTSCGGELAEPT